MAFHKQHQMPWLTNHGYKLRLKPFWNYEGGNANATFWLHLKAAINDVNFIADNNALYITLC